MNHSCRVEQLVAVITDTRSRELYQLGRERNALKGGSLICLFEAGFPDPWIEQQLAARLHRDFRNDSDFYRRRIVRVMDANGTQTSLDLLVFISLELADANPVRICAFKELPQPERPDEVVDGFQLALEIESAVSFRVVVDQAIGQIKKRLRSQRLEVCVAISPTCRQGRTMYDTSQSIDPGLMVGTGSFRTNNNLIIWQRKILATS